MEKHNGKRETEIIETTVGDLIEAITSIALESGKSEEEGYELARLTLEGILRRYTKEIHLEAIN